MNYTVMNKSRGMVVYTTPTFGRRLFVYNEKKELDEKELNELVQQPGGRELFYGNLYCPDTEFVEHLLDMTVEPEYKISPKEMPNWIQTCELDVFKDALDFAPDGMKDLIKKLAVDLPLNDYSKRQAIKDQLGFDVTAAIENSGEEVAAAPAKTGRRVAASSNTEAETPARRVIRK